MYTENDFDTLRKDFLEKFMTGTYRKRELIWSPASMRPKMGPIKDYKRYLAEATYRGVYQHGAILKRWVSAQGCMAKGLILGRYYTLNEGHWKNYRARVLFLDGPKKGQLGFMSCG